VRKYSRAGEATDGSMAHAHFTLSTSGYNHTLGICNTYNYSTARVAARTDLNISLYVNRLFLLNVKSVGVSDNFTLQGKQYTDWTTCLTFFCKNIFGHKLAFK
jgi:hypothetical protein